jgi:hypothetical protein
MGSFLAPAVKAGQVGFDVAQLVAETGHIFLRREIHAEMFHPMKKQKTRNAM